MEGKEKLDGSIDATLVKTFENTYSRVSSLKVVSLLPLLLFFASPSDDDSNEGRHVVVSSTDANRPLTLGNAMFG